MVPTEQIQHRLSCHRCGNIRKTVIRCSICPQVFCITCSDKMIEMDGEDVFTNGCSVCRNLCCCGNRRSVDCTRKHHCYKKCLSTKNQRQISHAKRGKDSKELAGNSTESSEGSEKTALVAVIPQPAIVQVEENSSSAGKHMNKRTAVHVADGSAAKRTRSQVHIDAAKDKPPLVQEKPSVASSIHEERPLSILHPVSFTPVNNVFFLQSVLPPTHPLPTIQPLLELRPTNYVYDLSSNYISSRTPIAAESSTSPRSHQQPLTPNHSHTKSVASAYTPLDLTRFPEDGLLFTPDGLESLCGSGRGSSSLAGSLLATYESDDTVNRLIEFNNKTMQGLCTGTLSTLETPSRDSVETEDPFSFHNSELFVTPIEDKLLDVNCSVPTSWTGQSFDLSGVIYSPVGFVDIRHPINDAVSTNDPAVAVALTAKLRELSSLFGQEESEEGLLNVDAGNFQGLTKTDQEATTAASQMNPDFATPIPIRSSVNH